MALNLTMTPEREELKPRITVFGVGGAGGNAVNNMIDKELEGVEFVVANTDAQALQQSKAAKRIQMGVKVTEGLGAGARPTVGAAAAEETIEEIVDNLAGAHMCFITAGMGGGTGTGAAPIIAQAARELGVLTVGVVTKPFQFEGAKRMRQAEIGIEALQNVVDTLIIIPNQNLFRLANERTTFTEAFAMADDVLYQGVKGVTDLMVRPGLINLDFADVRSVMDEMGKAMMGTGESSGEDRAIQAAEKAIANPLLDEISLHGAKGVLINITGGHDLTLFELDEAANLIREKVDPDANIIVGSTLDPSMEGRIRVSVVATGIDAVASRLDEPLTRRSMAAPLALTPTHQVEARQAPRPAAPVAPPVLASPVAVQHDRSEIEALHREFDAMGSQGGGSQPARRGNSMFEDDLPPPAYQPVAVSQPVPMQPAAPQAPAPAPRPAASAIEASAGDFVAPRPRPPGTPTPEALARLQAAVSRPAAPGVAPKFARPVSGSAPAPAPVPMSAAPAAAKPRFGIGSLINRMAGGQAEAERAAPPQGRTQPPVTAYDDDPDMGADQDRIEIPAFLRRQAN
jgi:cell division protein FtsZ